MPWPRLGKFGFVQNPLTQTPFVENNSGEGSAPPPPGGDKFLLMTNGIFLLENGGDFLLMN